MSRVDYGTVQVTISGKDYTLKPTLSAYQKIDSRMGGLRQAIESCSNMSIDGLVFIIAAAAGVGQKDTGDLAQAVFEEGTMNVLPKVTEYLLLLLNPTGKEAPDKVDDESPGE
jgi:hypothetical protein